MRMTSVVMRLRRLCAGGLEFQNKDDMLSHGMQLLHHPRLQGHEVTEDRTERRQRRLVRPTERYDCALYRCDGASQVITIDGEQHRVGGSGAAYFASGTDQVNPVATAYTYLGPDITNNVAEYHGLIDSLTHAGHNRFHRVCVQSDSLIVVKQVRCEWACRNSQLRALFGVVRSMLLALRRRGANVIIEHIYREYNHVADGLAAEAIRSQASKAWESVSHDP